MLIVPDKTIACIPVIPDKGVKEFDMNISSFLRPLNEDHRRDWFTPNFYRCLPLSIGNMQGFVFYSPFTIDVIWNGGNSVEDVSIETHDDSDFKVKEMNHVYFKSEFGNGIFTAHFPLMLKTPPGINLMTISPPNYPLPGISPMTGVVESDNLRFTFTLNFKIDIPNVLIRIEKGYPLMGILPIPRYFCDSFSLVNAYDIFDKNEIENERKIAYDHALFRHEQNSNNDGAEGSYYKGTDFYKNKFKDHQLPKVKK